MHLKGNKGNVVLYSMEYYPSIKRKFYFCSKIETILLCKINKSQRQILCIFHVKWQPIDYIRSGKNKIIALGSFGIAFSF